MSAVYAPPDGMGCHEATYSIFTHYLERLIDPETVNNGKYLWLAPEINFDRNHYPSCDVWGIGCLTYELLTGKPPFYEETKGIHSKLIEIMEKEGIKFQKI